MDFSYDIEILSLDVFDAAFLVAPGEEEAVRRRFMTLFVQSDGTRRGGSAEVLKASNADGEAFAVKRMRSLKGRPGSEGDGKDSAASDAQGASLNGADPEDGANASSGPSADLGEGVSDAYSTRVSESSGDGTRSGKVLSGSVSRSGSRSPTPDYVTAGHVAAFYEEYRMHLAVSNLRGFPRLYGFGLVGDEPHIIMEWVEGTTLREAARDLALGEEPGGGSVPDGERVPTASGDAGFSAAAGDSLLPLISVADVGIAVLELLGRAAELDERFVHRDISPRNIILRSDRTPPDRQLLTGEIDLCLVDFGSAALSGAQDPTFTMGASVWRMGTPAYAPPEMLTADVELPDGARHSEKVDVYALSSVLYELYCGNPPFDIGVREASPYRVKAGKMPPPLQVREPDGGALADILIAGLAPTQEERPTVSQMHAALGNWKALPGERSVGVPPRSLRLDGARESDERRGRDAAGAERQAGDSFWEPGRARRIVTRRRFVAAGIVGAAAIVSGILVAGKLASSGTPSVDPSRYTLASGIYAGEPLFKALDSGSPSWMLCTEAGEIRCRPGSSRECGALRDGLVALYDDASGLWGYVTPVDAAEDVSGCAWAVLPAFAQAGDFSEGLAAAKDAQTGLWGFIDAEGDWRIAPRFGDALAFGGAAAAVRDDGAGGLWGAIDSEGGWLIEPRFTALGTRTEGGFAVAEESPGRWGIVDGSGTWTSASRFDRLRRAASGADLQAFATGSAGASGAAGLGPAGASSALVPARASAGDSWGFVDGEGRWAIDPKFRDARPFSCGQAAVQDEQAQLWYFIGADGAPAGGMAPRLWKLGELFDGLAPAQASASDSKVVFDEDEPDIYAEFAGMRYGYVDAAGSWQMRRLTDLVDTAIGIPAI